MNSQDVELHPLDIGPDGSPMRSILRNKNERDFYDVYDSYGTTSSKIHLQPKETFFNNGIFPSEPMIIQDLTQDWTKSVYEMILCQTIGTTIIIFSNLLVTKKVSQKTTSWRQLSRSPLPVCGAVGLASLLSLLHSNISWNPLYLLVLITLQALHGKGIQLAFNHLLFWIGPIIGALLGAIIFKLLFAPTENKRVIVNDE
uniref:Uncharacterized protein n=1 Tax=Panagrolaimus superbus TaxID=310955 RepID=A0A914ZAI8_9BILA